MRTIDIDEEIRFHLSKDGWYLGDSKINIVRDRLLREGIDSEIVNFTSGGCWAWVLNGQIHLNQSLLWRASLAQIDFLALHEYFHIRREDCVEGKNTNKQANHAKEYDCDRLALKHLFYSGRHNIKELYDAINVFGDVINEKETTTHPSSKDRYKRLLNQIWEMVS